MELIWRYYSRYSLTQSLPDAEPTATFCLIMGVNSSPTSAKKLGQKMTSAYHSDINTTRRIKRKFKTTVAEESH